MFFLSSLRTFIVFVTFLIIGSGVHATTNSELEERLSKYKKQLSESVQTLNVLNRRKVSYQEKLVNAKLKLKEAKEYVIEVQSDEKRSSLAEYGLQTAASRYDRLLRKSGELTKESKTTQSAINSLNIKIKSTKSAMNAQIKLDDKSKVPLNKTTLEVNNTTSTTLAEKSTTVGTTSTTHKAASNTDAPTSVSKDQRIELKNPIERPTIKSIKKLTPKQQAARKKMDSLRKNTTGNTIQNAPYYDELILEINRDQQIELEHLGNNHFYSEIQLNKGKHKLSINLRQFVASVPPEEDGDTYVIIYDARKKRNARLAIFNKRLLSDE